MDTVFILQTYTSSFLARFVMLINVREVETRIGREEKPSKGFLLLWLH